MKIKPQQVILYATLFVVIGIGVTMITGLWHTESDKIPKRLEAAAPQATDGQISYDPADIRGSYTFGEISRLYQIPLADLSAAFQIAEGEAETFKVKDLKAQFESAQAEIGTASLRMFAAFYLGIAYEMTEETYLPDTAAKVLYTANRMTAEQAAYVTSHTASINP